MELAEAQILGWHHAKHGYDLETLCDAMGLTKKEWNGIKKNMSVNYLGEKDVLIIEEYLRTTK